MFCVVGDADAQCQHGIHLVYMQEREGRRCQELAFLRLCGRVYDAQQVGGRHCHTEILRELRVGLEHLGMVRHDRM